MKYGNRIPPVTAVVLLFGLFGFAGICGAAPFGVRLSYTDDNPTTMTVTWNTASDNASEVHYGTSSGSYSGVETGSSAPAPAPLGYVHEVTLTGLDPDTVYYYIAGNASDGFSAEYSFVTRPVPDPVCGSFNFVFLADNRPDPIFGGGQNWADVLLESAAHQPAFFLNGGDLVTDGDNYDGWVDFLNWTQPGSAIAPFMPCIGNHDDGPGEGDGATYNQLFALPRSQGAYGSNTEDYYYFTFANAVFAVLSTEGFKGGATAFGNQAAWLDEVLTQNPRKWKFVMFHKPIYTKEVFFEISHPPDEEGQNAALVEVIDAHHVDVVFTSHNHWYERFEPSACGTQGDPGSDQPCPVGETNFADGTVYIVSGGAGAFTIPGVLCGIQNGRVFCSGYHHYVLMTLNNETLDIQTWSASPRTNEIIDSVTIVKAADDCGDLCPNDPDKTDPGICGCGVPDTDTDSDGTPDCVDLCPQDPQKTGPGDCGCGVPDIDTDSDGTADCVDQCPQDPQKTEPGICGCGTSDQDRDSDGTPDCNDECPDNPDKIVAGDEGCGNGDDGHDGGTADDGGNGDDGGSSGDDGGTSDDGGKGDSGDSGSSGDNGGKTGGCSCHGAGGGPGPLFLLLILGLARRKKKGREGTGTK